MFLKLIKEGEITNFVQNVKSFCKDKEDSINAYKKCYILDKYAICRWYIKKDGKIIEEWQPSWFRTKNKEK